MRSHGMGSALRWPAAHSKSVRRVIATALKWSGKTGQRAKMYPTLKTGYTNDEETQFFGQVQSYGGA